VAAIGGIGLPESKPCLDALVKLISEAKPKCDSQVKCMAVWAVGRLASLEAIQKCRKVIVQCLTDPFYKVRSTACCTLVQFGKCPDCHTPEFQQLANAVLPSLEKLLRDGQMNKQAVAETVTMMGPLGEQILVKLCKGLQQTDLKLKCSILRAFALANVDSPSIDFVLEVLLKAAK
jgi:hypothetical protein